MAGKWQGQQPPSLICDIPPHARLLFLNFAQARSIEQIGICDRRRQVQFLHATHGLSPSIYIISPLPREFEGLNLYRYVVPSEIIAEDDVREELNQKAIDAAVGWSKITRNARPIVDRDKYFVATFAVREDDIVDQFRRFAEARPATSETSPTSLQAANPRKYFSTQREALRQFIPYQMGRVEFLRVVEAAEDETIDDV